ncbi:MAG TPA: hypothetical protein VNH41_04620, partial [Steroidobacteraceae bacterium]|nr:hypothetical protein [Steroidobacteraceae bacterium]
MPGSLLKQLAMLGASCALLAPGVAVRASAGQPPTFNVPSPNEGPLVLVVYGDTRFTVREDVVNSVARRALVERIASENPAAILIG